jgi:Peptidase family C25
MQKNLKQLCCSVLVCIGAQAIDASNHLLAQPAKPTVILVRPSAWAESLAEWKTYRSPEYQFVEVDSIASSLELRKRISTAARNCTSPAVALVLCGDAALEVSPKRWQALTPGVVLETQIQLGELTTKELCTDALYGDLDQDGCPDIAIGRLPAKTPEELSRMLRRSIDYEALAPDLGTTRSTSPQGSAALGF